MSWAGDVGASVTYLDIPSKPVVGRNTRFNWEILLHWCARMNIGQQYCALSQKSSLLSVSLCLKIASAREFSVAMKGCRCSITSIRFVSSPYVSAPKILHGHDLPRMLALKNRSTLCSSIFCAVKYNQQARSTHRAAPCRRNRPVNLSRRRSPRE